MKGPFTGRHMLAVMVGGFGIVIAVNMVMATMATRTFPGLVVENSYVASQSYNEGLEAGRAQKQLGWLVQAQTDGPRLVVTAQTSGRDPLTGATVTALLVHPLGRADPARIALVEGPQGIFQAPLGLPTGQWDAEITVSRDGARYWKKHRIVVD